MKILYLIKEIQDIRFDAGVIYADKIDINNAKNEIDIYLNNEPISTLKFCAIYEIRKNAYEIYI